MARYVVDANVLVNLVGREVVLSPFVEEFWDQLSTADVLIGPRLLIPECTSAIRSKAFHNLITHEQAMRWVNLVLRLPLMTYEGNDQFTEAVELARRFRVRKAYDMQYLATALIQDCELVTLDPGLGRAAATLNHPVRLLR